MILTYKKITESENYIKYMCDVGHTFIKGRQEDLVCISCERILKSDKKGWEWEEYLKRKNETKL
jgi:hypothetical protein